MSGRTDKPLRINEKIKPISPTIQVFIKDLLFNDDAYLVFLQNLKASLTAHGIDPSPDISPQALIDFRFALENARIKLNSDKKLRFEDIFRLPVLTIDDSHLNFKPKSVGIDTSVEKYIVSAGIIVLQTPTLENLPRTQVMSFKSIQHNLDLINEIDHTVEFNGELLSMYQSYTVKKVFVCLITLDETGKAVRYSGTVHS